MQFKVTPENFWSFVIISRPEDCWEWWGPADNGRGRFMYQKQRYFAARWSWEIYHGKQIPDGKIACHHCDNPICVNPHHIFIGTFDDNNKDRARKGRSAKHRLRAPTLRAG